MIWQRYKKVYPIMSGADQSAALATWRLHDISLA